MFGMNFFKPDLPGIELDKVKIDAVFGRDDDDAAGDGDAAEGLRRQAAGDERGRGEPEDRERAQRRSMPRAGITADGGRRPLEEP